MSNIIQLVCIECCVANGGELKEGTMAQTFIGKCQCCGEIKPLSNIDYWKNLPRVRVWESTEARLKKIAEAVENKNVEALAEAVTEKEKPKAKNAPTAKGNKLSAAADFS